MTAKPKAMTLQCAGKTHWIEGKDHTAGKRWAICLRINSLQSWAKKFLFQSIVSKTCEKVELFCSSLHKFQHFVPNDFTSATIQTVNLPISNVLYRLHLTARGVEAPKDHYRASRSRKAGERGKSGAIIALLFQKGSNGEGTEVPFHHSITGNFMVYQDRIETNLLQLFAHPEISERFSIISVLIF